MTFTSVFDSLPEPDRRKRYFVQTEEGKIWLLPYDPPRNAVVGEPTKWWDDENDSGYIIAWAETPDLENPDWREHIARFEKGGTEELEG